jgi:hypothetical protein
LLEPLSESVSFSVVDRRAKDTSRAKKRKGKVSSPQNTAVFSNETQAQCLVEYRKAK